MAVRKVILARPRGFCAGVVRAHDIVARALEVKPGPVYVLKEIVHNRFVVDELRRRGARFVQSLEEVPQGGDAIFSAHGVAPGVRAQAQAQGLRVIDATCPLVTKVHLQVKRYAQAGYAIILVGHPHHDEVVGTMGEALEQTTLVSSLEEIAALQLPDPERVLVVTQTTLSVDDTQELVEAIRQKYPRALIRNDICYATQNRQEAVKAVASQAQVVLVLGSRNSSNSNRLREVTEAAGARSYLLDSLQQLDPGWLEGTQTVGITAGASTPEFLVEEVLRYFQERGVQEIEEVSVAQEDVDFGLPAELMAPVS